MLDAKFLLKMAASSHQAPERTRMFPIVARDAQSSWRELTGSRMLQEAPNGGAAAAASLQIDLPTFPHAVLAGLGQAAAAPAGAEQPLSQPPSNTWIALQVRAAMQSFTSLLM